MMVNPPDARHVRTLEDPALRNRRHKEERWRRDAKKHIATMRVRGLVLTLTYHNGTPHWRLGNLHVENGAAELVINHPEIVGVGDTLFQNTRSQTFRYAEPFNRGANKHV
jgi:hypothetical protein